MDATQAKEVFSYLRTGRYPKGSTKSNKDIIRRRAGKFTLKDGLLHYVGGLKKKCVKVVTSEKETTELFRQFHDSAVGGHSGIVRTTQTIASRFYWPGMTVDIRRWVTKCEQCQKNPATLKQKKEYTPIKDLTMDGFPENVDPAMESPRAMTTPTPREAHVLVGVTGSVAALKLPLLVSGLLQIPGVQVQVVTTDKAKHFYNIKEISVPIFSDDDEWKTCVVRAWDISKPLLFCPAMNTAMWNHPITAQQIKSLLSFGYTEIPCIEKTLVCGDTGLGAMAEVDTIIDKVREVLSKN
ncbi:phosphopantothenoylcysteine decarboxylase isoform X2 [Rana temporaria]|uniref:phosphopantothenoylcysteine decarboxylase isoform X2 n=1 Tax=Rana temporaria TaxID=8407 RepID=UPI001AADBA80|nr:phosphopantothenoylcysteine decarboxylase isoform X2 [Rana temporaria]